MRQLFFCARDIRDYLGALTDMNEFDSLPNFDPKFPPLTDAPAVQKFFRDLMTLYDDSEQILSSPVVGETDIDGLRLDFNFGLRLEVPQGNFHVRISDDVTDEIFFDREISDVQLVSVEKYFIRWRVEVFSGGTKIFEHVINLKGQPVFVAFKKNAALGDTLAFLSSLPEFAKRSGCELTIFLPEFLREFAAHLYPEVKQIDDVNLENYATFYPTWAIGNVPILPVDPLSVPLERLAEVHFGMKLYPVKKIFTPTVPPVTHEPYVCIGVQASIPEKAWLYPDGWNIVVDYLKTLGYKIFCIDKNSRETSDKFTIDKPTGAEDFTGNFSIMERANMLHHAEFFIGLGSGLAWVANAVNCPVVMICGFSLDWCEFDTPYRVANRLVCNGCFNNVHRMDFLLKSRCPYHDGTAREFECQKKISPRQVIEAIERLLVDRNLNPPAFCRK